MSAEMYTMSADMSANIIFFQTWPQSYVEEKKFPVLFLTKYQLHGRLTISSAVGQIEPTDSALSLVGFSGMAGWQFHPQLARSSQLIQRYPWLDSLNILSPLIKSHHAQVGFLNTNPMIGSDYRFISLIQVAELSKHVYIAFHDLHVYCLLKFIYDMFICHLLRHPIFTKCSQYTSLGKLFSLTVGFVCASELNAFYYNKFNFSLLDNFPSIGEFGGCQFIFFNYGKSLSFS